MCYTVIYMSVVYIDIIIEPSLCRLVLLHLMNGILYVIIGSTVDLINCATTAGVGYISLAHIRMILPHATMLLVPYMDCCMSKI